MLTAARPIQDLGYAHSQTSFSATSHITYDLPTSSELAFAIGALSHHIGDTIGHSEAINPAVAIEFPDLRKKYGPSVSYAQNRHAHVRAEFAFDVNEASKRHLAPLASLRHAGLRIPYQLLAQGALRLTDSN